MVGRAMGPLASSGSRRATRRVLGGESRMARIFLSHSSKDAAAATLVSDALERAGHHVFLDQDAKHGIIPGEHWQEVLDTELRGCDALVFLNSVQAQASVQCS